MSETANNLIAAGQAFPGAEAACSPVHPLLMRLAVGYARWMAWYGKQGGHRDFQVRFDQVNEELGLHAVEITAETWSWQRDLPLLEVGAEMWKCWSQSEGHWRVASARHKFIGAEMLMGRKLWFACVIVAD